MPEIRFRRIVSDKIAGRLAARRGNLVNRMELFSVFLLEKLARRPCEIGGHHIGGFHILRRTCRIENHAGALSLFVEREKHFEPRVFARFHADEIGARRVSVHFRFSVGVNGAAAVSDARIAECSRDSSGFPVFPCADDAVRDDGNCKIGIFFRRERLISEFVPCRRCDADNSFFRVPECDGRRAVCMNGVEEYFLRVNRGIALCDFFAQTVHELLRASAVVD